MEVRGGLMVSLLDCQPRGLRSNPSRHLAQVFCSTRTPSQLSYDENTDRTLWVGRQDGEGEDWPLALMCRG